MNYGVTTNAPATRLQQQSGRDEHSIVADAQFIDPAHGDYRVKDGSPALALGFVNFPMDRFGAQKPELKAIARTPQLPQAEIPASAIAARDTTPVKWLGASVRNIRDEGEMSAFGAAGVTGVLVLDVSAESSLAKAGLRKNDVILSVNGGKTADTTALLKQAPALPGGSSLKIAIFPAIKKKFSCNYFHERNRHSRFVKGVFIVRNNDNPLCQICVSLLR